ncbi:DnaJ like protein subfamily A member 5 [Strigomonas culicis]|nr:DnaJ like protein subfamily A member 5 [Strigomonas culicis]EPY34711.1 DnaJ like protein subfamily A member 5 [Strigomonas culicis]|eukprot:EPY31854.1 DnaJ like protein subfamily A member 5 [Strigomonas culicis]
MSGRTIRCYYEVLEVERKATSDEIRSAYKKKSLQYHPDRNYGNTEEAAVKFKEVQNAYTVLSDVNERAWYDAHRESILRGGDGSCDPDEINLYAYFSASCYDGYEDDEGGFYAVYRKVFDTLIEEEGDYESRAKSWPTFGDSGSAWADVQKFYTHWRNFSTVKHFAWKDEYKVNEMEDRYTRRAADRINQKARSSAKKEYVQNVQSLAQFVYRRDPRVKAELERQEQENAAKEEEQQRRDADRQRKRRAANEKMWAEAAEKEEREEEERAARGETMDGSVLEMLYEKQRKAQEEQKRGAATGDDEGGAASLNCPACKKRFKTSNQFKEHVNSNKHKTKLKQLASKGIDVEALMKGDAATEERDTPADDANTDA